MKLKAPSPSMVVACAALVMASTGTAVAAVTYATNAGKVDGKDAVASSTSRSGAAGNVVATASRGPDRGKIPGKFLDDVMRGGADSFARPAQVQDNATDVVTPLVRIPGLGSLSASCFDQNPRVGVEDPASTLTLGNESGQAINLARTVPGRDLLVGPVLANTTSAFTIGGSNTFRLHIERGGINFVVDGVVRQDGRGTPTASCLIYGYAVRVQDVS